MRARRSPGSVAFCGDAIVRDSNFIVAHIGIVCGEEDAIVSGKPGDDESPHSKVFEY